MEEKILGTREKTDAALEKEAGRMAEKEWFRSLRWNEKLQFISMLVLDPLIVLVFCFYYTQSAAVAVLVFLLVDAALIKWRRDTQIKKLKYKAWLESQGDRKEILLQKIRELGELEEERKRLHEPK